MSGGLGVTHDTVDGRRQAPRLFEIRLWTYASSLTLEVEDACSNQMCTTTQVRILHASS